MRDYDGAVRAAKDHALKTLCRMNAKPPACSDDVAQAFDCLNKAWDDLTDALVRQREERDKAIRRLMDELAERKETR